MPDYPAAPPQNNEIDIIELMKEILAHRWAQALLAQKWLVIGITLVTTLAIAAYVFTIKPVYESTLTLMPPSLESIEGLKGGAKLSSDFPALQVAQIYSAFTKNILNESIRQAFFSDFYSPRAGDEKSKSLVSLPYQSFSQQLVINAPGTLLERIAITLRGAHATESEKLIKAYVEYVAAITKKDIQKTVMSDVRRKLEEIDRQIDDARLAARSKRERQIAQRREALAIAKSLGMRKPAGISGKVSADALTGDGGALYMRGIDALAAEIQNLESRKSDDPFIEELDALLVKRDALSAFSLDFADVPLFIQDGALIDAVSANKPNRILILMMGVMLGGVIGLLVALARIFINVRRRQANPDTRTGQE